MNLRRLAIRHTLLPLILFTFTSQSYAWAGSGPDGCQHRPQLGLERPHHFAIKGLGATLDLNDAQKESLKSIQATAKPRHKKEHPESLALKLIRLNPDAADYNEQVNRLAEQKAARLKSTIIEHATLQRRLYEVLNDSQKQKYQTLMTEKNHRQAKYRQ